MLIALYFHHKGNAHNAHINTPLTRKENVFKLAQTAKHGIKLEIAFPASKAFS